MNKFKSILLIDDDEISNYLCEETIKCSDTASEVVSYNNADDALRFLEKTTKDNLPDIIFLDINMPGMDGWEFLEDLKRIETTLKKNLTVIILSTSKYKLDIEKSKRFTEVAEYITKPLTPEILMSILSKHSDNFLSASTIS